MVFSDNLTAKYGVDFSKITPEELTVPTAQLVAEAIGVENTIRLAEVIGGVGVYLPKAKVLVRKMRNQRIIDEFNGSNYAQLAIIYDVSERWIREIVNGKG